MAAASSCVVLTLLLMLQVLKVGERIALCMTK